MIVFEMYLLYRFFWFPMAAKKEFSPSHFLFLFLLLFPLPTYLTFLDTEFCFQEDMFFLFCIRN